MRTELKKYLFLALAAVFLAGAVFGEINYYSNSVVKNYTGGEKVRGSFRISLDEEKSNSVFTSNFNGNVSLLNFLELNNLVRGGDYFCSNPLCDIEYSAIGSETGFSLSENRGKLGGFKLTGQDVHVTSAGFNLQSNVQASCTNQIFVDVLDDDNDFIVNTKHSGNSCGIKYGGCFEQSSASETTIQSDRKFCEKVSMPSAPGFYVGAKVKNGTSNANLQMILYDAETGSNLGNCILPKHTQTTQELECIINYTSNRAREYFVCITSSANVGFKINWESETPNCGTVVGGSGAGFNSLGKDFEIFAETIKFKQSPLLEINNSLYNMMFSNQLSILIDEYIQDKYGRDCRGDGCVVPVRFFGENQFVQLSNAQINYETGGVPASSEMFYALELEEPVVSAENISLDLGKANFVIPIDSNENKLKIYLDNDLIFQENINVRRGFLFDVSPKFVPFGQDTLFNIIYNSNISSSVWNFGDGSAIQSVSGRQARHSYVQQNSSSFDVNVTATSQNLTSTRTFRIFVGSPRELANMTITDYKIRIQNISGSIEAYPLWIKDELKEILKVDETVASLNTIENDYINADSENEFREVMLDLIELNVPREIKASKTGIGFPLTAGFENINVNYIERISNKEAENRREAKSDIASWANYNFGSETSFEQITAFYDFETDVLISKFKIETKPLGLWNREAYLIFGQDVEASGKFMKDYSSRKISGLGIDYIEINKDDNEMFEFYLNGEIEPETLGAYIAPEIDEITSSEISGECNLNNICDANETRATCPEDCSKRALIFTIVGWIVILILGFGAYIFLQEWYKKNYERHLFKKENEVYNLINFIYNARKSGLMDKDIKSKLGRNGWENEKIRYAFNKIDGKRLMLFEIPLFKSKENKKVVREIAARQSMGIDARFIKRPYYR